MATVRHYPKITFLLLLISAQPASAELLFTNFDGDPFGGTLYTGGGPCSKASCYAIVDNFNSEGTWTVSGLTYYMLSPMGAGTIGPNVRYALFTASGDQVVAPTDVVPTVTDTGLTGPGDTHIYQLEITELNINLVPGEYQFRATNTVHQDIYPAYGNASAQTQDPGLIQLTGSPSLDPLLSTEATQRDQNWAFQVYGTTDTVFADGFETP